ncbi:MAG: SDR family oxidoreductase [Sphingorhabdus sp.]|nr:SDR family oxidoreductase [Sphingorhabdus sp.]
MTIPRGDVILVTGATGAIGSEIAAQAAETGAIVAVHGSSAESVAGAMERFHVRVADARLIAAPADFREEGAIEAMVAKVAAEAGRIDAVVHCGITGAAGVAGPLAKADAANFGDHAALVLGSFQRLCYAALPHLSVRGGTIIGFASDAGKFASPRQAIIGAAFGGIMTFVRNLALEVSRQGVRVHCISPSFVADTPVFEKHAARAGAAFDRAGLGLPTPKDIAPIALFLCGPGAAKITGQIISINGGLNA